MSKVEVKRVFDGWDDVDCEDCGRYWDSSCDGLKPGMRKQCGSYVATRKVVTLNRIEKLERKVELFGAIAVVLTFLNAIWLALLLMSVFCTK